MPRFYNATDFDGNKYATEKWVKETLSLTEDGLIPDMHKINWENKEVYLCFDNDICYKSQVLNALRALTYQLQDFGAIVKNIKLPTGKEVKNG